MHVPVPHVTNTAPACLRVVVSTRACVAVANVQCNAVKDPQSFLTDVLQNDVLQCNGCVSNIMAGISCGKGLVNGQLNMATAKSCKSFVQSFTDNQSSSDDSSDSTDAEDAGEDAGEDAAEDAGEGAAEDAGEDVAAEVGCGVLAVLTDGLTAAACL